MDTNAVFQIVSAAMKAGEKPPTTEWIVAISSALGVIGIIFIFWQTVTMKRQLIAMATQTKIMGDQAQLMRQEMTNSYELARRQLASELMMEWSKSFTKFGSMTRYFIEKLDKNQCRSLANQEPFTIQANLEETFSKCLAQAHESEDKKIIKDSGGNVIITKNQAGILRSSMVGYLNLLESILAARHHGIADKDMIKEQFSYLYNPKDGFTVMKEFRQALGLEKLPAMQAFYLELEGEAEAKKTGKPQMVAK